MKRFATHTTRLFLLATASLLVIPNAMTQGVISQGGASFEYYNYACTDGGCGQANFFIGADDNAWRAWWWFRVDGDTQETIFPAPDTDSFVGNAAVLDWADVDGRGFSAQAVDVVTEGGGGGSGTTLQDLTLTNNTGGALDIEVFLYIDVDAGGDFGGDEAELTNANDFITITDDDGTVVEFRAIGADAYQVTGYSALAALLVDGSVTDLDNTGLPFGPGDFTGAFQWSASIPAGESQLFRGVASVDESAPLVSGWRLLSVPGLTLDVQSEGGVSVQDLADLNLIQGVTGSYPGATPNLLVNYDGPTGDDYTAAGSTGDFVPPGKGFWWYLFDDADFGGAPPPEFVDIEEFQFPIPTSSPSGNVDVPFAAIPAGDQFYMVGNPFQAAFDVDGVVLSSGDGTLGTNFSSWDPGSLSYITRTAGDFVSVWEGFWAEITGGTAAPTFTMDVAFVATGTAVAPGDSEVVSGPSEKKDGARVAPAHTMAATNGPPALNLRLRGTLDGGQQVNDLANRIRFEEDAMFDWDRHDGSKLMPPPATPSYALLSLEGVRNGDARRQAVRSLPSDLDEVVTIPASFLATEGGAFEISATSESLPEGWSMTLQDLETGDETNLLNESHAFTAVAGTDWQDRFSVTVTPAGVVGTEDSPAAFRLSRATPNPATDATALVLRVDAAQRVTARVFDVLGRLVVTTHDGTLAAGEEIRLAVDTAHLAPGAYVVRVEGETFSETRRVTVMR